MSSAAAAIGRQFLRRHQWGFGGVGVYVLFLIVVRIGFSIAEGSSDLDNEITVAFMSVVPFAAVVTYFLAVFSFGLDGDLAARESLFPARMFTLPLRAGELAGWPMFFGMTSMMLLWAVTRPLALWPSHVDIPVWWPALLGACAMGWIQALAWLPYPARGLRVVAILVPLVMIDVVTLTAWELDLPEAQVAGFCAVQIPIVWAIARWALIRARRGETPDWREVLPSLERTTAEHRDRHFASAGRAQSWFEWRRHGRVLPALTAILLPFELAMLFLFRETTVIVWEILVVIVLTPPLIATFVAASVRRSNADGSDMFDLGPFLSIRPVTAGVLVAAKLRATVGSTIVTWVLVLASTALALRLSNTTAIVVDGVESLVGVIGAPRAATTVLLILVLAILTTWRQLVQSLYIGLSGRPWLVRGSLFGTLALLTLVFPVVSLLGGIRSIIAGIWNVFPWIIAVLASVKVVLSAGLMLKLRERSLATDRTLLLSGLGWSISVVAFYAVLAWMIPMMIIPDHILIFISILVIPLTRIVAVPLALEWNRHR